ncbi:hypothetical protein V7O66_06235 [Methanolobus sp. ZRKC3]|uniref:hypothetical protein n=1 Tax=Methanolobus sp. ZRKC3 TaxID=3125786 RepID=UPI003253AE60
MCIIEQIGYSRENKETYCTNCIIQRETGKCEYLKYLETKVSVDVSSEYIQEITIDECGF